ncbi:MAG: hypothetical protein RL173_449 [Fibrobacterota bacterium]|jgi:hypothetical protein
MRVVESEGKPSRKTNVSESLSPEQIVAIAKRLDPMYDASTGEQKLSIRETLDSVLKALDAEGYEVGQRTDRSTFEMAQWMFLRVEANISSSTPKAVIILSLHGAILSAVILQGDRIVREAPDSVRNLVGVLVVGLFLAAVGALWFAFNSVAPRIAKDTGTKSLLFFGSIARMAKTEFVNLFSGTDRAKFSLDLIEEVHALSGLADSKHRMFVQAFRIVLYLEIPLMAVIALLVALG